MPSFSNRMHINLTILRLIQLKSWLYYNVVLFGFQIPLVFSQQIPTSSTPFMIALLKRSCKVKTGIFPSIIILQTFVYFELCLPLALLTLFNRLILKSSQFVQLLISLTTNCSVIIPSTFFLVTIFVLRIFVFYLIFVTNQK